MEKYNEKVWLFLPKEELEKGVLDQVDNMSSMFFVSGMAIMADAHVGKGCSIGSVISTKGAIIPAAVGVDIGCGMIAVKTNLIKEQLGDLSELFHSIERSVPMSAGRYNKNISESAYKRIKELEVLSEEIDMDKKFNTNNWRNQLGTLGGGNHFIEICLDENKNVWVTLHSGSRGIGNKIGMYYISKAQELCKQMLVQLPDPDLAYLPEGTELFNDYIKDMRWAQHFALLNRDEMMDRILKDISFAVFKENGHQMKFEIERINPHHNFTQIENHFKSNCWITRKGAIKADIGLKMMIPGSMGTKSYIVSGLGNPMSFNSAPHGAGRRFSRSRARKEFTMEDFDKSMKGIIHKRSKILLDEIPGAYKDVDLVIEQSKNLIKVEHILRQILNCKGD